MYMLSCYSYYSANVLLDSSMQAKVGDFGLARQTDIEIANKTGTILGTSGYIPPEYYAGEISTKTDVYAFGVVVLEVLTGLPSFDGRCDCKELVICAFLLLRTPTVFPQVGPVET